MATKTMKSYRKAMKSYRKAKKAVLSPPIERASSRHKGPHIVLFVKAGRSVGLKSFRDKAQALKYVKDHRAMTQALFGGKPALVKYWGKVPIYGEVARRGKKRSKARGSR